MRNKFKLTEQLVALLPEDKKITADTAKSTWWYNLRPEGGLRLTATGYKALAEQIKLEFYAYKIEDVHVFNQKTLIALDKKLKHPYYIVTVKNFPTFIIFFDSKEAMMINLYGDLTKFLDNYQ